MSQAATTAEGTEPGLCGQAGWVQLKQGLSLLASFRASDSRHIPLEDPAVASRPTSDGIPSRGTGWSLGDESLN